MRGIRCVSPGCTASLYIYIYIEQINLRGGTLRTSGQVFIRDGRRRERG